jgi:integrase
MVLRMARPQKHRDSGIYWFRMRVPDDLRPFVGKTEINITLRTRDPVEAAIAHHRVAAEVAARWREFRKGVQNLSHKQIVALAGRLYREMVAAHEDNPGPAADWRRKLESDAFAIRASKTRRGTVFGKFAQVALDYLNRSGIRLSSEGEMAFVMAVADAVVQGDEHLLRNAEGDYSPDPRANRFPEFDLAEKEKAAGQSLVSLYDVYAAQVKHSPATIKRWRPKIREFETFIAPRAWHLATRQDAVAWHDALLKTIKPITVRDVHFAANKALYGWLEDRDWCANPFGGLRVRMPKYEDEVRGKWLTEDEARKILRAASAPLPKRLTPEYQAAFKWVPWICAYTGARVNEITQLRKQDVRQIDGVWVFHITPEAGAVKTGGYRDVPVHPHLVEMGLLGFVKDHAAGPLFYNPDRGRGATAANPPYKKVGGRIAAWVRKIGVKDPHVQPNHGWRHRMSTILMGMRARDVEIDAILGHKGPVYGHVELAVKKKIIGRVPRINLGEAAARSSRRRKGTVVDEQAKPKRPASGRRHPGDRQPEERGGQKPRAVTGAVQGRQKSMKADRPGRSD